MFKPRGVGCCKCKEPISLMTEVDEIRYLSNGLCKECEKMVQEMDHKEMEAMECQEYGADEFELLECILESLEEQLTVMKEIRDELRNGRVNYSYNFYGYGAGSRSEIASGTNAGWEAGNAGNVNCGCDSPTDK